MENSLTVLRDRGPPFDVRNEAGRSPFVLICEHASAHIPADLAGLGLSAADLTRHIAWDIGAAGLTARLADRLDAALIQQIYSRLVIDCNRAPDAHDAVPAKAEATIVPGNRDLSAADRQQRIDEIYTPFHDRITDLIDARLGLRRETIVVTIHSFTPVFKGEPRTIKFGILHNKDARLADLMLGQTASETGYSTARNEPYDPKDGVGHTTDRHGEARGLLNVMLEIRNDLIAKNDGQDIWADRIASLLRGAIKA